MSRPDRSIRPLARAFESLRAPHFAAVYAAGWLFAISRWGLGFLGAFAMNELTHSPRLVQLTGTCMWAPLLLGGLLGGALADRFDRKTILLTLFFSMAPLTVALGALELSGALPAWTIFPFMVVVGLGWVVDMTARRALVFQLVGPGQVNNAMALEMVSASSGLAIGTIAGGAIIEFLGIGAAYVALGGAIAVAGLLVVRLPAMPTGPSEAHEPFLQSVLSGLRTLPGNPVLVSVLGVTVIADFFYFAYAPIIQVIGERVGASPALIGVLGASTGIGMMLSSLWVAATEPHRGRAYVVGSAAAMVLILGFALFDRYSLVLASLFASSLAFGLFGATQGALTMTSVPDAMRGRAMGLLSMAIGSLPLGMWGLGELAERVGAPTGVVLYNVAGLAALVLWLAWRPESYRSR